MSLARARLALEGKFQIGLAVGAAAPTKGQVLTGVALEKVKKSELAILHYVGDFVRYDAKRPASR